jgi:tetratricopeptide (TPR) repeat protein
MKHWMIALACTAALAWPASAPAAGGGGGGGAGGGGGEWGGASQANSDPDFVAGMAAVKTQDWQQVIARMGAYTQRKPDDADGWNELGHAYRRTGQMDPAFDAYGKALKINPKHRGAHEYLGEAYLQVNDLPRAEQELKTLDKLCFFGCEEYSDLKHGIEQYKKGKSANAGS